MVMVKIGEDVFWEFTYQYGGELRIQRNAKILGYTFRDIPFSERLLDIALEGICQDIKSELKKEQQKEGR